MEEERLATHIRLMMAIAVYLKAIEIEVDPETLNLKLKELQSAHKAYMQYGGV